MREEKIQNAEKYKIIEQNTIHGTKTFTVKGKNSGPGEDILQTYAFESENQAYIQIIINLLDEYAPLDLLMVNADVKFPDIIPLLAFFSENRHLTTKGTTCCLHPLNEDQMLLFRGKFLRTEGHGFKKIFNSLFAAIEQKNSFLLNEETRQCINTVEIISAENIKFKEYIKEKKRSIEIATHILNEEGKPVGLSYPNKTARDKDHIPARLNGLVHKDQSTQQEVPDKTFNLENNLVCRHLSYLKSHQARGPNGSNRGLNLDEVINLYEQHGDWDQKKLSYNQHPIHFLMAEQLGADLAIIAQNMAPGGPNKSLLLGTVDHMMHVNMQYKQSTDGKPNRFVLNFWDPNRPNEEIRVVMRQPSELQFIEFKHLVRGSFMLACLIKEQSIISIQDLSSIEQLTIPLFPKKTPEQKENFITALCVVSKVDDSSGLLLVAKKAPEQLQTILGFAEGDTELQKEIITALCVAGKDGWSGLFFAAMGAPEQLPTILGFVKDNTKLQKKIINALCIVSGKDGWSALRHVAMGAPEQLPTILGFVKDNTKLQKKIINALCIVSGKDGWSALRLVAMKAPEQLPTILGFAERDTELQKEIITDLCVVSEDGWSGLRLVAKKAPEQLQTILGFVKNNTDLQEKIITALCVVSEDGWSALRLVAMKAPEQLQTILRLATTFEQIQRVINAIFTSSTNTSGIIWCIEHKAKCKPTIVNFISFLTQQASLKIKNITGNTELQKIITDHLKELKSFEPKKIRKLLVFLDAINKSDNLDSLHDKLSDDSKSLGVARKTTRDNLYGLFMGKTRTESIKVLGKMKGSIDAGKHACSTA